jgi:hypothetical protein
MDEDEKLPMLDHAKREDAHAGQVLSVAKLLAPFSAALGASFLVAALQVGRPTTLDYVCAWIMLLVLMLTVGIVSVPKATLQAKDFPRDGEIKAADLSSRQRTFVTNVHKNLRRATWVRYALLAQVFLSSMTCVLATIEVISWLKSHPPQ